MLAHGVEDSLDLVVSVVSKDSAGNLRQNTGTLANGFRFDGPILRGPMETISYQCDGTATPFQCTSSSCVLPWQWNNTEYPALKCGSGGEPTQVYETTYPGRTNFPALAVGVTFTLKGLNFAGHDTSVQVVVAQSISTPSCWISDTSVRSIPANGAFTNWTVSLFRFRENLLHFQAQFTQYLSYDKPVLRQSQRLSRAEYSGISIALGNVAAQFNQMILGSAYVPFDTTPRVNAAGTLCESSKWLSDSTIYCLVSTGIGSTQYISGTVSLQYFTTSRLNSYDRPEFSNLKQKNAPVLPTSSMTVSFVLATSGLSRFSGTPALRMRGSASANTAWLSTSTISCQPVTSKGSTARVGLTLGSKVATVSESLSFDKVKVTDAPSGLFNTGPMMHLVIDLFVGRNLGFQDLTARGRIGSTSSEFSRWFSDTQLQGKVPVGITLANLLKTVTSALNINTIPLLFSFDLIQILPNGVVSENPGNPSNFPAAGISSVTITGINFGNVDTTGKSRIHAGIREATSAASSCYATTWIATTAVLCQTPTGVRGTAAVSMTVILSQSTMTKSLTYDLSLISGQRSSNIKSDLGFKFAIATLAGQNFGRFEDSFRLSAFGTVSETLLWLSDTYVICNFARGVGASGQVVLTFGERMSVTVSLLTSFDSPSVRTQPETEYIETANNSTRTKQSLSRNYGATGSAVVFLTGQGFGKKNLQGPLYTIQSRLGETAAENTRWTSESSVSCKQTSAQASSSRTTLTLGILVGSLSACFSQDSPSISSVYSSNTFVSAALFGVTILKIAAIDAGLQDMCLQVFLGKTAAENTKWISETSLRSQGVPAGAGRSQKMVLSGISMSTTRTALFSFDSEVAIWPAAINMPATGSSSISVTGLQMLLYDYCSRMRLGQSGTTATNWFSSTSTQALAPSGLDLQNTLHLTVQSNVNSLSSSFSFNDYNSMSGTRVSNSPCSGASSFTLQGAGFGLAGVTVRLRFAPSVCEITSWRGDTSVHCKMMGAGERSRAISITLGNYNCQSATTAFSFNKAGLSTIKRQNSMSTGSISITVEGSAMGQVSYSPKLKVSYSSYGISKWVSETSLSCKSLSGNKPSRLISVTVGGHSGSQTGSYSCDSASLSSIKMQNIVSTGSASLTLAGYGFNLDAGTIRTKISISDCESSDWISDTSLQVKWQGGFSSTRRILLTGGTKLATTSSAISFALLSLSISNPVNSRAKTRASYFMLAGQSFDSTSSSLSLSVGNSNSAQSIWRSDTAVAFKCPSGLARSRKFILSASTFGTVSLMLTYDRSSTSNPLRTNQATTGSARISLAASGFGISSLSVAAPAGRSSGESTRWISDSTLGVKVASGAKPTRSLAVTAGIQVGTITEALTFHTISLSRLGDRSDCVSKLKSLYASNFTKWRETVSAFSFQGENITITNAGLINRACVFPPPNVNMALTAFSSVTVMGSSFGNVDLCCGMRVGFSSGARTLWISDTCMFGLLTLGTQGSNYLLATQLDRIKDVTISASFTFDTATISSTKPYNDQKMTPSFSVSIYGHNFACYVASCTARIVQTNFDTTIWLSDTSLNARRGDRGYQATSKFSATCGGLVSSTTRMYSYDVPSASRMYQSNQPPLDSIPSVTYLMSGSYETDLTGINFAFNDPTVRSVFSPSQAEATFWVSDTIITSITSRRNLRQSRRISLTTGNKVGTLSSVFSFDVVMFSTMPTSNSASTGASLMFLLGGGMARFDSTIRSRIGYTVAEISMWISDSSCLCAASSSRAISRTNAITAGERSGSGTYAHSFQAPAIHNSQAQLQRFHSPADLRRNMAASGSVSITLQGSGFALSASSNACRITHSAVENSRWLADTSVRCLQTHGAASSNRVSLTVGVMSGSISASESYDFGSVKRLLSSNFIKTGSASITLIGQHLSSHAGSASGRQGQSCAEQSTWLSETGLSIKFSSGFHYSSKVSLTVGMRVGSITQILSYSNPTVSTVRSTWLLRGLNITQNNEDVKKNNSLHYGTVGISLSYEWCANNSQSIIPLDGNLLVCSSFAFSNDTLSNSTSLSASKRAVYTTKAIVAFRAYVVRNMWIESKRPNWIVVSNQGCKQGDNVRACLGDYQILSNLSAVSTSPDNSILVVNMSICNRTQWFSPTAVECAIKSYQPESPVITVDIFFGTSVNPFVYGLPLESSNVPSDAPMSVMVSGSGFEEKSNTPAGGTAGSSAEQTSWIADSMITLKVAHFISSSLRYMITLGEKSGSSSQTMSFNRPSIVSVASMNESSTGNYLVSMSGVGFGSYNQSDHTAATRIGSTACQATLWIADSHIRCRISWGLQSTLRLIQSLGVQAGTLSEAYSFERPMLSSLTPANSPATGR